MTKLSELNIKVLKKCKDCGIYPSVYFIPNHDHDIGSIIYECAKCNNWYRGKTSQYACYEWNQANGFDENDEHTWCDDYISPELLKRMKCKHEFEEYQDGVFKILKCKKCEWSSSYFIRLSSSGDTSL